MKTDLNAAPGTIIETVHRSDESQLQSVALLAHIAEAQAAGVPMENVEREYRMTANHDFTSWTVVSGPPGSTPAPTPYPAGLCYARHELAPGVHADVPHAHETMGEATA